MRIVDVGGRLVEVHVRESRRARAVRLVHAPGEFPELVVPVGTGERAIDRAITAHRDWLARRLEGERPPVLELGRIRLTEREARSLARARLTEAAEREAPRVGVAYERIAIRDTRSRWASCSPRGTLSFSWRLVLAPVAILDYVVVHELCHLRHLDHSRSFWRLVETVRPTYRAERTWLRDHGWELLAYRPASA